MHVWRYGYPRFLRASFGVKGRLTEMAASIICVDIFIRLLPGKKNFKIAHSNHFLSTGLSLSFGVMVSGFLLEGAGLVL